MSKDEKEKRINSLALTFLESQQIVPNLYADQIIRGYKEGYHQAEKDNELTWEDMMAIDDLLDELLPPRRDSDELVLKGYYEEILKRFKDLKK